MHRSTSQASQYQICLFGSTLFHILVDFAMFIFSLNALFFNFNSNKLLYHAESTENGELCERIDSC